MPLDRPIDPSKLRDMGHSKLTAEYVKYIFEKSTGGNMNQDFLHLDALKDLECALAVAQKEYEDLPWTLDEPAFIHALRWAIAKLEETK